MLSIPNSHFVNFKWMLTNWELANKVGEMSKLFSSFCYCSFVWSLLIIDCNCISVHLLVELDHLLLIWRVRDLLSSIDYIYFDTHTHTHVS